MQYPAIWHSFFYQISLTKLSSGRGNYLLDAAGFRQVNCSKAPINSRDFLAAKPALFWALN